MATQSRPTPPGADGAHRELMVLRNQVIEEKASRRVLERQIEETKGAGVPPGIVEELLRAHDQHGRIIEKVEARICGAGEEAVPGRGVASQVNATRASLFFSRMKKKARDSAPKHS